MKNTFLNVLALVCTFAAYSQTNYKQGYFIDNQGNTVNCLIRDLDWKNNPTEFDYKLSETSQSKTAKLQDAGEFGISNIAKYQRISVEIDRSSSLTSNLGHDRNLELTKGTFFLKYLVEGPASLYSYEEGNLKRYFYKIDKSQVQQLNYKKYIGGDKKVKENSEYRQQLWNEMRCGDMSMRSVENLKYKERDFVKYFESYNTCKNQDFVSYRNEGNIDLFNFTIRPGISFSSFKASNEFSNYKDVDFGSKLTARIGAEIELILPFNRGKWAVIMEPTFQFFKAEDVLERFDVTLNYKSVQMPLGLRYYFILNQNSKIFVDASYGYEFPLGSKLQYQYKSAPNLDSDLEMHNSGIIICGLGYKYAGKYSVELRYNKNQNLLGEYPYWNSDYTNFSLIFGYTLL